MRKTYVYLLIAILVGFLSIIVPLIAFAELNLQNHFSAAQSISKGFRGIEGSNAIPSEKSGISDLEVVIVSFVVAMSAYLIVKRRMPVQEDSWARIPP